MYQVLSGPFNASEQLRSIVYSTILNSKLAIVFTVHIKIDICFCSIFDSATADHSNNKRPVCLCSNVGRTCVASCRSIEVDLINLCSLPFDHQPLQQIQVLSLFHVKSHQAWLGRIQDPAVASYRSLLEISRISFPLIQIKLACPLHESDRCVRAATPHGCWTGSLARDVTGRRGSTTCAAAEETPAPTRAARSQRAWLLAFQLNGAVVAVFGANKLQNLANRNYVRYRYSSGPNDK